MTSESYFKGVNLRWTDTPVPWFGPRPAKNFASFPDLPPIPSCDPVMESFTSSPPDSAEEEHAIRYFVQRIIRHRCNNCGKNTMTDSSEVIFKHAFLMTQMRSQFKREGSSAPWVGNLSDVLLSPKVFCVDPDCKCASCPCCASKVHPFFKNTGSRANPWCCNGGRLFYIFALLCGPHAHPQDASASIYQHSQVKARLSLAPPRRKVNAAAGAGTGYGGSFYDASLNSFDETPRRDIDRSLDALPEVFSALAEAWPSLAINSTFDKRPPALLLAITRRSPLLSRLVELMQDEFAEGIIRRPNLYSSLWGLLAAWSRHPFSAPLLADFRLYYPFEETLLPIAFGDTGTLGLEVSSTGTNSDSKEQHMQTKEPKLLPRFTSLFPSLASQARFVSKHQKGDDLHSQQVRIVCSRIWRSVEAYDAVAAGLARKDDTPTDGSLTAQEQRREELERKLSESAVLEIDGNAWHREYHYADELRNTEKHIPRRGRMKRLVSDLSILQTSLPEGIFVRHHSDRLDAMTFLIVGPIGTPYENGLFEFDLFCPMDYPQSPPQVFFRTSPPDRKLNPNLYVSGTVCLSLLGTFDGPSWDPESSTLLQVLVSLQAMVFSEEPLWNEPGWKERLTPLHSRLYNVEVRADTTRYALAEWLRRLNSRELEASPWREIVAAHFELRWREILAAVERWEADQPGDEVLPPDETMGHMKTALGTSHRASARFKEGIRMLEEGCVRWMYRPQVPLPIAVPDDHRST